MSWYMEKCGEDVVIIQNGFRLQNRSGEQVGPVMEISTGRNDDMLILKCKGETHGLKFSRTSLLSPGPNALSVQLNQATSNEEFISLLLENSNILQGRCHGKKKYNADKEQVSPKRIRMPDVSLTDVEDAPQGPTLCPIDEETESCFVGKFDVSVMTLSAPPDNMMCREVNRGWVEKLKTSIKASPSQVYATLPCSLEPSQVPNRESFVAGNLCSYTVYTLGGNHLRTALQELLQENDTNHFDHLRRIGIHLYIGLTKHQARRLGCLHNKKTETCQPSLFDRVKLCRRVLYEGAGKQLDEGEPPQSTAEWKLKCQIELAEETKTIGNLTTIFHMAQYSSRCWSLLCKIFTENVANAKTKGQTIFQKLQGLSEAYRWELLTRVSNGSITLDEAGREAKNAKKMELIRSTFNFLTKSASWSQAMEKYPEHSNEDTLKRKFLGMAWERKNIPTEFVRWCKDATENKPDNSTNGSVSVEIKVYKDGKIMSNSVIRNLRTKYQTLLLEEVNRDLSADEPSSENGTDLEDCV